VKFVLPLVALILVTGCANEPVPHYERLKVSSFIGPVPHYPTPAPRAFGTVKVFQKFEDVPQPYEVVGLMGCDGVASEEPDIITAMLYRAADLDADAVVLNPKMSAMQDQQADESVNVRVGWAAALELLDHKGRRGFRAAAVKFKPTATVPGSAPSHSP
jgi:hypothetical protein